MIWIWEHIPLWRPDRCVHVNGVPLIVEYIEMKVKGQRWPHIECIYGVDIRWRPTYPPLIGSPLVQYVRSVCMIRGCHQMNEIMLYHPINRTLFERNSSLQTCNYPL